MGTAIVEYFKDSGSEIMSHQFWRGDMSGDKLKKCSMLKLT